MNLRELAIENGDLDEIEKLYNAKIEIFSVFDCKCAVMCGRLSSLKKLIDLGCKADWQSPVAAAAFGNLEMFQFLFESGFEITAHCASQASLFGHAHILRFILKNKLVVDWRANANARFANHPECSFVLKNSPIDVRREQTLVTTTFDHCARQGLYHQKWVGVKSRLSLLFYGNVD